MVTWATTPLLTLFGGHCGLGTNPTQVALIGWACWPGPKGANVDLIGGRCPSATNPTHVDGNGVIRWPRPQCPPLSTLFGGMVA